MVDCPTCHAQVLVPSADEEVDLGAAPAPGTAPSAPAIATAPAHQPFEEPLFERSDFSKMFKPPADVRPAPPAAMPEPQPANGPLPGPRHVDVEPAPAWVGPQPQSLPAGYVVTPARASILTVIVILLMALAFGAGLVVGRFL